MRLRHASSTLLCCLLCRAAGHPRDSRAALLATTRFLSCCIGMNLVREAAAIRPAVHSNHPSNHTSNCERDLFGLVCCTTTYEVYKSCHLLYRRYLPAPCGQRMSSFYTLQKQR